MREAMVTFLCKGKKSPGSQVKVRFSLKGTKANKMDLAFKVVTSRPAQNKKLGHICVGYALVAQDSLNGIEDLLRSYAERPQEVVGRRSPRLPVSLRVMGRELPGFGAVTVDISQHGVRLNCSGLVKVGLESNLTLESDMASVENMQMRARVIWSAEPQEKGKGYLAGLEFVNLNSLQADALERYNKGLWGRLRGDVMHRQIADGEFVAREVKEEDVIPSTPTKGGPPPPPGLPKGPPPPPVLPKTPPPPPPPPPR